jgi:hypothetical protein
MSANESLVFLTVRGTTHADTLEAACKLHNETAGSAPGIAAARALGDLSHKVFTPVPGFPGVEKNELLFLDYWASAEGLGKFFADPQVQGMAGKLFAKRDGAVWMTARGAFGFHLPPPATKNDRYLGIVRGAVKSPEKAIEAFRSMLAHKLPDARRRGQLSHDLFVSVPMPGAPSAPEIIGIDLWYDAKGMGEHYGELSGLYDAFSGKPQTSVWEAAKGGVWSEW